MTSERMKELKENCKKCASTLTVEKMQETNSCSVENCQIKKEFIDEHIRTLCADCKVYGCSYNPEGQGYPGVPLFFAVPEGCQMMDCDSSI